MQCQCVSICLAIYAVSVCFHRFCYICSVSVFPCLAIYAVSVCFHVFSYICSIHVFPYHQLLGLLSSRGGQGISTVLNDLCVCCANKSKSGADKSAHELHSEQKESLYPMLEDEPMPAGFTGLLAQSANH